MSIYMISKIIILLVPMVGIPLAILVLCGGGFKSWRERERLYRLYDEFTKSYGDFDNRDDFLEAFNKFEKDNTVVLNGTKKTFLE